jgi:hypothetical protein
MHWGPVRVVWYEIERCLSETGRWCFLILLRMVLSLVECVTLDARHKDMAESVGRLWNRLVPGETGTQSVSQAAIDLAFSPTCMLCDSDAQR